MLALSIRQPFAELILRGIKTVEYRTRPTRVIGRRFWIYAVKGKSQKSKSKSSAVWSRDLVAPAAAAAAGEALPEWMIELAEQVKLIGPDADLSTGVIVGTAVIEKVTRGERFCEWHLADVERAKELLKPDGHPQPVWFNPF